MFFYLLLLFTLVPLAELGLLIWIGTQTSVWFTLGLVIATGVLGAALADVRDRVLYATKVFSNHLKYDQVIEACHRSLKNLKTDYIDLYQIHWPAGSWGSKSVTVEESKRAINDLKQQGKSRAIGVSNFSRIQMEEAGPYARIDSLQSPYSLLWRHVEKDAMPYCIENNITILAYSSMAQGILTENSRISMLVKSEAKMA